MRSQPASKQLLERELEYIRRELFQLDFSRLSPSFTINMASDDESDGNGPSRRPSAGSTAGRFDDDEWESISSNPFSGDFPTKKTNANFRSELGIFVNVERESNGCPSTDERGGRATLPRAPRRQSGTRTTSSYDGDDWERIEHHHHSEDGNASRRGSSSDISRGWTFEDGDGGADEGDGYLADEGYYEVEGMLLRMARRLGRGFAADTEWQTPKTLLVPQIIRIEAVTRRVQDQLRPIHPAQS